MHELQSNNKNLLYKWIKQIVNMNNKMPEDFFSANFNSLSIV